MQDTTNRQVLYQLQAVPYDFITAYAAAAAGLIKYATVAFMDRRDSKPPKDPTDYFTHMKYNKKQDGSLKLTDDL